MTNKLLSIQNLSLQVDDHMILKDISLDLSEEEIVVVIGKSGCGKSTLMRIICGLINPSSGKVEYYKHNMPYNSPSISMVFQSFALFPWLTVKENIALALEGSINDENIINAKVTNIIDLIGLSGYENAYPKEMSGGMRQRIGIARALVVEPEIMLMDEPFSVLDVLTSAALKSDIMDLWIDDKMPLKSIMLITHNIEEAVMLANRVVVLSSNPGTIVADIKINIKHPRNPENQEFKDYVKKIYSVMMPNKFSNIDYYYKIPNFAFNSSFSLLELVNSHNGRLDIHSIEQYNILPIENILPTLEFLEILKFVEIKEDEIIATHSGKILSNADIIPRKKIIAEHLLHNIPLISYIVNSIKASDGKTTPKKNVEQFLNRKLPLKQAKQIITAAINWGRYCELFTYDINSDAIRISE